MNEPLLTVYSPLLLVKPGKKPIYSDDRSAAMSSRSPRTWRVVGGGDKGGIVVRCGEDVQSELQKERLGFGAVVVEVGATGGLRW